MASASVKPIDVNGLPHHLFERVHMIRNAPVGTSGDFVLYWMHHAVRSHENPALDTALYLATQLKVPVLVYQGLSGRHPFNSDRHPAHYRQYVLSALGRLFQHHVLPQYQQL